MEHRLLLIQLLGLTLFWILHIAPLNVDRENSLESSYIHCPYLEHRLLFSFRSVRVKEERKQLQVY